MSPQQIAQLIEDGLGGSHAMVTSEDNVHFEAVVIAPLSSARSPFSAINWSIQLWARRGHEIHALALQVFTPDEYARQGRG